MDVRVRLDDRTYGNIFVHSRGLYVTGIQESIRTD